MNEISGVTTTKLPCIPMCIHVHNTQAISYIYISIGTRYMLSKTNGSIGNVTDLSLNYGMGAYLCKIRNCYPILRTSVSP